jgi:hypothetical protein
MKSIKQLLNLCYLYVKKRASSLNRDPDLLVLLNEEVVIHLVSVGLLETDIAYAATERIEFFT